MGTCNSIHAYIRTAETVTWKEGKASSKAVGSVQKLGVKRLALSEASRATRERVCGFQSSVFIV